MINATYLRVHYENQDSKRTSQVMTCWLPQISNFNLPKQELASRPSYVKATEESTFHQHPKQLALDWIRHGVRSLWYQQRQSASSSTERFDQGLKLDCWDIFIKDKIDSVSLNIFLTKTKFPYFCPQQLGLFISCYNLY